MLRPGIYIYPESAGMVAGWTAVHDGRIDYVLRAIANSPHHTQDGQCADFFVMHNYIGAKSTARVHATFEAVARGWPWWNLTAGAGLVRHLLIAPGDHGPGDMMYDRRYFHEGSAVTPPGSVVAMRDIIPAGRSRKVGYITLNGDPAPDRLRPNGWNAFRRGVDVRVPQYEDHQCGPLCGAPPGPMRARLLAALPFLSLWSPQNAPRLEDALTARRRHRLFWAGLAPHKGGERADLLRAHARTPGFALVASAGSRWPSSDDGRALAASANGTAWWFQRAMAESDFCLSPPGQTQGDSDRYLPALLFGCIPVFVCDGEQLPLSDVIPWNKVSVRLGVRRGPDGAALPGESRSEMQPPRRVTAAL